MEGTRTLTLRDELFAWFAATGAAAAWVTHFLVGYFLSEAVCSTGEGTAVLEPLVIALTAGLGAVAATAGLAGVRLRRRAEGGWIPDPRGRLRWMGLVGTVSAVIFVFLIVLEGIQVLQLSCEAG